MSQVGSGNLLQIGMRYGKIAMEAAKIIKQRWPNIKIVVLTMYGSSQADALAAGADEFLVKGCPTEELLDAILGLLGEKH
jgi:DNA-binding NarL/FixJ family response regulator